MSVWVWAAYAFTGLIVLSLLPQAARGWAIAIIVAGGLAYAYKKNPNVYTDLKNVVEGKTIQ